MARLISTLRGPIGGASAILQLLEEMGYIKPLAPPSTKWEASGWLDQATDLRNEFTHRRTYGHASAEKAGHVRVVDAQAGLYRYFRPISINTAEQDVFDVIVANYERMNELFFSAAKRSGYDHGMMHLTDEDIISMDVTHRD